MIRSTFVRSAVLALLLCVFALPAGAREAEGLARDCPQAFQDLWQAAADFLLKLELPDFREAISFLAAPEPAGEGSDDEFSPEPTPTLGAEWDPNG